MKTKMVTGMQFETLESRACTFDTQTVTPDNPDVKFLQDKLDRLDAARKCVSIGGFEGTDVYYPHEANRCFFETPSCRFAHAPPH